MRISEVRIQNFRCFADQTITFNDYTCLVGSGGTGKSTVLTALRIFFRDTADSATDLLNLREEDFHGRDVTKDIIITITFTGLEPEAQKDFEHYFRQGKLIVSSVAVWNPETKSAPVQQSGERMAMEEFAPFFKSEGGGATVAELRGLYGSLRSTFPDIEPASTKSAMVDNLHAYEAAHSELCKALRSDAQFYGFTKGANLLQKYLQWVFVPAIKDARSEQLEAKKTAFGMLLERTVRSKVSFKESLEKLRTEAQKGYQKILEANRVALEDLSGTLGARLRDWSHSDVKLNLQWRNEPSDYVTISEPQAEVLAGEGTFLGHLPWLGHGLQRSFLLALLQELSGCGDTGNPRLVFACEEPELYQHPPQSRHLSAVLQRLSGLNAQVMITTHSPYFVSGHGFQDVRLFRREIAEDQPTVKSATFAEISAKLSGIKARVPPTPTETELKIDQALQPTLNEMFFSAAVIFVEGLEDFGYISANLVLTGWSDELRRLGCHMVPTSGKGNMIKALAISKVLGLPAFIVFDADGHDTQKPERKAFHEADNLALLRLSEIQSPDPFPKAIFSAPRIVVWPTELGTMVEEDLGKEIWQECAQAVRRRFTLDGAPNLGKNGIFLGQVLTEAFERGHRSTLLDRLCTELVAFARGVAPNS